MKSQISKEKENFEELFKEKDIEEAFKNDDFFQFNIHENQKANEILLKNQMAMQWKTTSLFENIDHLQKANTYLKN